MSNVVYQLTLSLDEGGIPIYEKGLAGMKEKDIDELWKRDRDNNIKKSFNIEYRDPDVLKLTVSGTYYYWENKGGRLVIAEIR